ncbi:hypothetical protein GWC77_26705, partial [Paraburkholderia sp. NMBU_R16]|nr:hypothetical protein [Paraburkholderia sp. NMBU_R16]
MRARASEHSERPTMNEQHLIEMANRIGEFFESMP